LLSTASAQKTEFTRWAIKWDGNVYAYKLYHTERDAKIAKTLLERSHRRWISLIKANPLLLEVVKVTVIVET